ncbi:MAG: N-glycosylase/DNA lyase [Archaeoglobaceae archaeon]|nr:N-glycosylase/DNA lyase [Archaeoglobaceae archaeon]MCX8152417.1 N-glycosylase/DNA lyase [Archaeoglobaceae archaeon]MDW8013757.1 N-glycosylase/DNA lyase [Archaeoglobaceae archaeon]
MSCDNIGYSEVIRRRILEFETLGKKGKTFFDFRPFLDLAFEATIESELAFCISTANSSAVSGLKFQSLFGKMEIEKALKLAGVRFWERKAEYIREALKKFDLVDKALKKNSFEARKELLNIKGLGMKEASHFLRNVGRKDVAIVDRHVLRYLGEEVSKLSKSKYLKLEENLRQIAYNLKKSLAELDLCIWAKMTGKVLK